MTSRVVAALLALLVVVHVLTLTWHLGHIVAFPYDLNYGEGYVLNDAPGEFGRHHWISRVFVESPEGESRPIAQITGSYFQNFINRFRSIMAFLVSPQIRPALRLAFFAAEESGL